MNAPFTTSTPAKRAETGRFWPPGIDRVHRAGLISRLEQQFCRRPTVIHAPNRGPRGQLFTFSNN
jgi:hypothetical protein